MASGVDRIGELPDALLVYILSFLPMNEAARADILSRRWRGLFAQHISVRRELDFVDFRHRHSPEQFVQKVSLYLRHHSASNLKRLHVSVHLPKIYSQDLESWVTFAATKGVEDLALDFTPNSEDDEEDYDNDDYEELDEGGNWRHKLAIQSNAFAASPGSLRSISLTWCVLSPDFKFVHLGSSIRRAFFRQVNIDADDVEILVSKCPTLEYLLLWDCDRLESVVVDDASGSSSQLKELVIANCELLYKVAISAPSLRSFQFYGEIYFDFTFNDVRNLEDALLSCVDRETHLDGHNPVAALRDVSHARVLTLCQSTIEIISMFAEDPDEIYRPVPLENLKELQLLLGVFDDEYLAFTIDFFRFCLMPVLEQIFIRLPVTLILTAVHRDIDPPELQFDHLKALKVTNFFGTEPELDLVLYFLEHAPLLEKLVLVTSRSPSPLAPDRVALKERLDFQISIASSPVVQLVFCGYDEDSSGLNPTHMETYDGESYTHGNI